jgi:hypothetical protein
MIDNITSVTMVTPIYPRVIEDIMSSGEPLRRGMYVGIIFLSIVNSDYKSIWHEANYFLYECKNFQHIVYVFCIYRH